MERGGIEAGGSGTDVGVDSVPLRCVNFAIS